MRRVLIIIALICLTLFGVTSLVCRMRVNRALNTSLTQINSSPRTAYETIREPLARNNLLTFGLTAHARQIFIDSLVSNGIYILSPRALAQRSDSFIIARQTMLMLRQIEKDADLDLSDGKTQIVRAAIDSSSQILREGTLDSWNELLEFFYYLDTNNLMPPAVIGEYRRWHEQVGSLKVRQLAVRQESNLAIHLMTQALNRLGLTVHRPGQGPMALPMPNENGQATLDNADKDLVRAITAVNNLISHYDDGSAEMNWIYELQGKLVYNHGAIMLTHALDQEAMARRYGTGFIASFVVKTDDYRVPAADELYSEFLDLIIMVLNGGDYAQGANDYFNMVSNQNDRIRAFKAMGLWNCGTCMGKLGVSGESYRRMANRITSDVNDSRTRAILELMRTSNRPLFIIELPEGSPAPE